MSAPLRLPAATLLDTGPLVAFLNRSDRHHVWAAERLAEIEPPLLTCESVVSEACFLLRRLPDGPRAVLELVRRGLVAPGFRLDEESEPVGRLMARFADQPMSLADACLVRMAELHAGSRVLTLDRHFKIYRMHGRRVVPALMPPG